MTPRRLLLLLPTAVVTVSMTACGLTTNQKAAIAGFSAATMDLADVATDEYVRSRQDVIEMREMAAKLGFPIASLEAKLTVERVKRRVDAIAALKQYGELLNTLTTSSQTAQIKVAADSFVANIRKVEGVDFSDKQAGAISSVIQGVGGLLIEVMRKRAVAAVVHDSHASIVQLIDSIERSFDPEGDRWTLGYELSRVDLKAAFSAFHPAPNTSGVALKAEAETMWAAKYKRFKTVSSRITDACKTLRSAEQEMRLATLHPVLEFTDIDRFIRETEDLLTVYKILAEN